jgi:lysine-specific demethylase 8
MALPSLRALLRDEDNGALDRIRTACSGTDRECGDADLDEVIACGFQQLTKPEAHSAPEAHTGHWRDCFALAAVLRAASKLSSGHWQAAVRLLDLALILGRKDGEQQSAEVAAACAPLLAAAAVQRVHDGRSELAPPAKKRRSSRLARSPAAPSSLPAVSELLGCDGGGDGRLRAAVQAARAARRGLKLLGALDDWAALRSGWASSLEAVSAAVGHRTVPIEVGIGAWGGRAATGRQQRLMRIDDFLAGLHGPESEHHGASPLAVTPVVPVTAFSTRGYCAQHQLFHQAPDLAAQIGTRALELCGDRDTAATLGAARVWLGPGGTVTPLHFDRHDNVLCQCFGAKLVLLCGEGESGELDEGGGALYPCVELANASRVDAEVPDLAAFPRFGSVPRRACVLQPGDALFIPRGVWHYVRSLSPSLSISFWFDAPGSDGTTGDSR